jgi:hypothetical protein
LNKVEKQNQAARAKYYAAHLAGVTPRTRLTKSKPPITAWTPSNLLQGLIFGAIILIIVYGLGFYSEVFSR